MNLAFFKKIGKSVVDLFKNKGSVYLLFGGMVFASTVTAAACRIAYKKLEKNIEKMMLKSIKQNLQNALKN